MANPGACHHDPFWNCSLSLSLLGVMTIVPTLAQSPGDPDPPGQSCTASANFLNVPLGGLTGSKVEYLANRNETALSLASSIRLNCMADDVQVFECKFCREYIWWHLPPGENQVDVDTWNGESTAPCDENAAQPKTFNFERQEQGNLVGHHYVQFFVYEGPCEKPYGQQLFDQTKLIGSIQ
ncbi:hypothetical protein AB1L88_26810 [Tautonia sp. JC769]|uniref:hypothetical protein n=1 Tax=Tautonia sp. JC769 TaxID=3232135 RepID=UPI003458472C